MGREECTNLEEIKALLNFQSGFRTVFNPFYSPPLKCENWVILEKLVAIERKLDLIFGDHVFINGRLVSLSSLSRLKNGD